MVSQFKFVDVDGTRRPNTAGVDDFIGKDGAIPEGPHSVALRHEPNEANPHAVAVYLDDRRHVGGSAPPGTLIRLARLVRTTDMPAEKVFTQTTFSAG